MFIHSHMQLLVELDDLLNSHNTPYFNAFIISSSYNLLLCYSNVNNFIIFISSNTLQCFLICSFLLAFKSGIFISKTLYCSFYIITCLYLPIHQDLFKGMGLY